ncbi:hypothetical protein AB205_0212020, partial [Aquarana catesbeiana]
PYICVPSVAPTYICVPSGAPPYICVPSGVPTYISVPSGAPPYICVPSGAPPYICVPIGAAGSSSHLCPRQHRPPSNRVCLSPASSWLSPCVQWTRRKGLCSHTENKAPGRVDAARRNGLRLKAATNPANEVQRLQSRDCTDVALPIVHLRTFFL